MAKTMFCIQKKSQTTMFDRNHEKFLIEKEILHLYSPSKFSIEIILVCLTMYVRKKKANTLNFVFFFFLYCFTQFSNISKFRLNVDIKIQRQYQRWASQWFFHSSQVKVILRKSQVKSSRVIPFQKNFQVKSCLKNFQVAVKSSYFLKFSSPSQVTCDLTRLDSSQKWTRLAHLWFMNSKISFYFDVNSLYGRIYSFWFLIFH